jgi:hypothetical protein
MSTIYTWKINQLDRLTADGFVFTVHYTVSATDGTYNSQVYGTVGYTQTDENYIPYADLTEDIVNGWVKASLGEATVQTNLQAQIDLQKNPPTATGLPWA